MADLRDIIYEVLWENGKYSDSKARLTKTVYLIDWVYACNHQRQLTDIRWYYDYYGPFVYDVVNTAKQHPSLFKINESVNTHGGITTTISINDVNYAPTIPQEDKDLIDSIVRSIKKYDFDEFIKLVYSTYPVMTSDQYTYLNLVEKAKEYKASKSDS